MMRKQVSALLLGVGCSLAWAGVAAKADVLTGSAAFGGFQEDAPGVARLITPADLPPVDAGASTGNGSVVVDRPADVLPQVPDGFSVSQLAGGLNQPRVMQRAPNGDVFLSESGGGTVRVFTPDGQRSGDSSVFADGLDYPYGLAFWPPGPEPEYLYVAERSRVLRFPYANGDRAATGAPEVIVDGIPTGGHWTRDVGFIDDGATMLVAVGSLSNDARSMGTPPGGLDAFIAENPLGATWGDETGRGDVIAFDADGGNRRTFATGIRNCSGLAIGPGDVPWCTNNERDRMGNNLPPDFVTRVAEGGFYGWPWYYIGGNPDPRHDGARPALADRVTVPDVLIQAHSAPLGLAFYDGSAFPAEYQGDLFVALHGSWNRADSTGFKVVRVVIDDGVPTGVYEDFMTGFVIANGRVFGRPTGVAVTADGALLISEDGNDTVWRIDYDG